VAAENAPGREQERVVQDDPDGGRACEQGAAARTAWRRGRNRGLNRYFLGTRSHRCRHATSCAVSAYAARTVSNARSSTSFDAFAANQSDVDLRRVDPASITRSNARASSSGEASRAISPFTPSLTSSVAAFSGPATTTLGVPRAAASTTIRPYPSRSEAV